MPRRLPAPLGVQLPLLLTVLIAACIIECTLIATSARAATALAGGRATCTIVGIPGRAIVGTTGDDVICGTNANDTIYGRGGNDTIYAGNGNDTITTGPGSDTVDGGPGIDRITTGDGNDTIDGGGDGDLINGGGGNDVIHGEHSDGATAAQASGTGSSTVTVCHWAGNAAGTVGRFLEVAIDEKALTANSAHARDLVPAPSSGCPNAGNIDVIDGGAGDDTIDGDSGNDRITGGLGNDSMNGGDGNDTERGGDGNDTEDGDGGEDHLYGDGGDDALTGGDGHDTVDGGTGSNSCHHTGSDADDTFTLSCGDHEAPKIDVLSISPMSVDTSAGPQTIDIAVHVTDNLSGVQGFHVSFASSGYLHQVSGDCSNAPGNPDDNLCVGTGTRNDATYTVHMAVPQYSATGTWHLWITSAHDAVGNVRVSDASALRTPLTFEQTGMDDTEAPKVTSASLSATTLTTKDGPASVRLRVHITENISGFTAAHFGFCPRGLPPSLAAVNYRCIFVAVYPGNRVAGTSNNGDYETYVELPRYSPAYTYDLRLVATMDKAKNSPAFHDWTGNSLTFTQTDAGDTTPPVVRSASLSSPTVNTKDGTQSVRITLRITDDLAGFDTTQSVMRSVMPTSQWTDSFMYLTRVSGTSLDGTYAATVVLPKLSPCGVWKLHLPLVDQAGNSALAGASGVPLPSFTNDYTATPVV